MEKIEFEGIDLSELLPRIPDSIKNSLPFGLVRLDTKGFILEYNMAEGDIAGVSAAWALGKNFFDEVALCTKTPAFYGKFLEGVKKGFMNTVFDYTFDHRSNNAKVRVHMFSMPDGAGNKSIMLMVRRAQAPNVADAYSYPSDTSELNSKSTQEREQREKNESVQTIITAVTAAMNARDQANKDTNNQTDTKLTPRKSLSNDIFKL